MESTYMARYKLKTGDRVKARIAIGVVKAGSLGTVEERPEEFYKQRVVIFWDNFSCWTGLDTLTLQRRYLQKLRPWRQKQEEIKNP